MSWKHLQLLLENIWTGCHLSALQQENLKLGCLPPGATPPPVHFQWLHSETLFAMVLLNFCSVKFYEIYASNQFSAVD